MTFSPTRLTKLGTRYQELRAELDEVREQLKPEIVAAHNAGMQQRDIVTATGYTREMIRQLTMSPEEQEALKDKRRRTQEPVPPAKATRARAKR